MTFYYDSIRKDTENEIYYLRFNNRWIFHDVVTETRKNDLGYCVTAYKDGIDFNDNIIISKIELLNNNYESISLRILPYPINMTPGDSLVVTFDISVIRDKKTITIEGV